MEGQAQCVEGVLLGAVRLDPVCMEGVFARVDWGYPGCSRTKQIGQDEAEEVMKGWDKRTRSQQEKEASG